MKGAFVYLLLILFVGKLGAQEKTISGVLLDKSTGKPVSAVSVNIKSEAGMVLAFSVSRADGTFAIKTTSNLTDAYLEINHLAYRKTQLPLEAQWQDLAIELIPQPILLDDIEVKSRPQIRRIGDTLSYNVEGFAKEDDRSIGDVISRLPGMEVTESGQIKYQGRSISKFYIDGDDLLEDRYTIGTRTIPHKMVKDLQVLNNHEHLKVLKNKRFTDEVAINLVIKDEAKLKLTGQAKVGAGLPKQYDSEVNTILFNKKFKVLNVAQGNNVGRDLTPDLIGFDQNSTLARFGTTPTNNLLSLGIVGEPPIEKPHYFMNNSFALNANNLANLANDWQLKSNIQGISDNNHWDFAGTTDYFTEDETISFDETQHSRHRAFLSAIRFTATRNVDDQFLENNFSFEYEKEQGQAAIMGNYEATGVSLNHRIRGITNRLQYVPQLKNGDVIQLDWFLNYGNKPQTLTVMPGIFQDILGDGYAYSSTIQAFEVPTLFSRVSAGYRLPKGKINQYYNVGFSWEEQRLQSEIHMEEEGIISLPTADATTNNLYWQRAQYSASADYGWTKNRWDTRLMLPIALQHTRFRDPIYQLNERQPRLLFNPVFQLKYRVATEDDLDFDYRFNNSFGNIQDIYRGIVIRNYRTLAQNSTDINESATHAFSFNYRWNRTVKLLFANIGLDYTHTQHNSILSQQISNDISQTVLLPISNAVRSFSVRAGVDKYVFALSSAVKLHASYRLSDFNQVFNGNMLPFHNTIFTLSPVLDAKVWRNINLSYTGNLSWSRSTQQNNAALNNRLFNLSQNIGLPLHVYKGVFTRLSGRHLLMQQLDMQPISYFFLDAFIRYRNNKLRTDFELNLTNLADIRTFETYHVSANTQTHNNYALRGRMAVFKVTFNL